MFIPMAYTHVLIKFTYIYLAKGDRYPKRQHKELKNKLLHFVRIPIAYQLCFLLNQIYRTLFITWVWEQSALADRHCMYSFLWVDSFLQFLLSDASFGFRVLSLPASVCMCVSMCQLRACPCDNSWPVKARSTQFEPARGVKLLV